jgi:hypothetical protein
MIFLGESFRHSVVPTLFWLSRLQFLQLLDQFSAVFFIRSGSNGFKTRCNRKKAGNGVRHQFFQKLEFALNSRALGYLGF